MGNGKSREQEVEELRVSAQIQSTQLDRELEVLHAEIEENEKKITTLMNKGDKTGARLLLAATDRLREERNHLFKQSNDLAAVFRAARKLHTVEAQTGAFVRLSKLTQETNSVITRAGLQHQVQEYSRASEDLEIKSGVIHEALTPTDAEQDEEELDQRLLQYANTESHQQLAAQLLTAPPVPNRPLVRPVPHEQKQQ
jgi:hypothetical protein